MSKLLIFTAVAVIAAVGVAIGSLVINIIILNNTNTLKSNQQSPVAPVNPSNGGCATTGPVSNSTGYAAAANWLLNGLDNTVDPCDDFYAFTCNKFLGSVNLDQLGQSRLGTYDQSQVDVNTQIAQALSNVNPDDNTKSTLTERITKRALDACVYSYSLNTSVDLSQRINASIVNMFGGAPFLGQKLTANVDLFKVAGMMEQQHALGTLMFSWASVDYKNVSRNALYVSQPNLDMPRDYFVKPQYVDKLKGEMQGLLQMMMLYAADLGYNTQDQNFAMQLQQAAQDIANFEVLIAMASWPDELLRNYKQQYNQYTLAQLQTSYPQIGWSSYLSGLFNGIQNSTQIAVDSVVLSQPSYFAWLDSVFNGNLVSKETIANYMILQLLYDDGGFLGIPNFRQLAEKRDYVPYMMRRGRGVTRIGRRHNRKFDKQDPSIGCLDLIMAYMPYGPGYAYVKAQQNRDKTQADVMVQTGLIIKNFKAMIGTLGWMSDATKKIAYNKADSLKKNFGWPAAMFGDFKDSTNVDAYNMDYASILQFDKTKFYDIQLVLKKGMEVREAFRLLNEPADRLNFLQSPAMVNAWYQPERNSITFPYAAWNPPYYNLNYPQAYNYAGQGGTGGHELTHGFDDEGVQFGADGMLANCQWDICGWMDPISSDGFTNMAQCVVSQYSTQCCPLSTGNVHCANGATTQGENIADLGGQQAAYRAYQEYISTILKHSEDRLPGLEQYTPNQVFWITYGYSWCMKQSTASLVSQILTNPHAPAKCRTNQVMQDIPAFGKDFNCPKGSAMYPTSDQRCKVWVGY